MTKWMCRATDCPNEAATAWVMAGGRLPMLVCRPHLELLAVDAPDAALKQAMGELLDAFAHQSAA